MREDDNESRWCWRTLGSRNGRETSRLTFQGQNSSEKGTDELDRASWGVVFGEDVQSIDEELDVRSTRSKTGEYTFMKILP